MADRYQQFADSPPGTLRASAGSACPQPAPLRRYEPASSARRPGAARRRPAAGSSRSAALLATSARRGGGCRRRRTPLRRAGLRRDRDRRAPPTCARVLRLLPPGDPRSSRRPAAARARHPARAAGGPAGDRPARARGLRALGRQGGRRAARPRSCVYVAPGAEDDVESTLRFLLSGRSAYVSGQVVRVGARRVRARPPTGSGRSPARSRSSPAPRAASARRSPRCSRATAPHVVCLDVPPQGEDLADVANAIGGSALQLDITGRRARRARRAPAERHGGVDIVVHNAGITRDKTLGADERRTSGTRCSPST